jgi:anti-sigma regulatory factor (Ser/Thr protein kinase)
MSAVSAPETLQRFYAAVPTSISVAREAVTVFAASAGASSAQLERIRLAASEALTNVVVHAYPTADGEIEVLAAVTGGDLSVLVADRGHGLRGGGASDGLGLGLALMWVSCDALTLAHRSGGGLEVQMRFALVASRGRVEPPHVRGSVASASSAAAPVFSTTT